MDAFSRKSLTLAMWGGLGALAAYPIGEFFYFAERSLLGALGPLLTTVFGTMVWTTIIAIGCTLALTMGQNHYLKRPLVDPQAVIMGFAGGGISGAVSGCLAEVFFQMASAFGNQDLFLMLLARLVAWAMFGGLIGLGMSFVIPNLGRLLGAAAGAVGGGIGAVAFVVAGILAAGILLAIGGGQAAALVGDSLGRCIGMVILGLALGFAIGLAEEATRTAWLQVTYGQSRESVRINLGPQPVCVGSDSRRCTVWAQGARALALKFRYIDGNVICDDLAAERTYVVQPGHQQQVGHVSVTVCSGAAATSRGHFTGDASPVPPPQAVPPPPAPPPGRVLPRQMTVPPTMHSSSVQKVPNPSSTPRRPPPPPPPPRRG